MFSKFSLEFWSSNLKIIFRFSFVFILLFIIFFYNDTFPLFTEIIKPVINLMHIFTPWVAKNILNYQYDYTIFTNGSSDTSYSWITLLINLNISILSTILWTFLDVKRTNYNALYYYLSVVIRYYIALMLIKYGLFKLYHIQMLPPGLTRLMTPLNEFSPMGLAWTFFGYSKGYNIFMGIIEICSALLLIRKFIALGAVITLIVSLNIMSINYFYDVPVKIISTSLFLFSTFLLIPYAKSLIDLFLGKQAQFPVMARFKYRFSLNTILFCKAGIIIIFTIYTVIDIKEVQKSLAKVLEKSPLYGIYQIHWNYESQQLIPHDWAIIVFEYQNRATVRNKFSNNHNEKVYIDTIIQDITINNIKFNYEKTERGDILLYYNKTAKVKLLKQNHESFELMSGNFHWIQDFSNNF